MEKDIEKTEVIFRKSNKKHGGSIVAIFPYIIGSKNYVMTYEHIGQHSDGDYYLIINFSKLATEEEYSNLKKELEVAYGYNLTVIRKRNYDKYLKEFYKINNR